MKKMIAILCAVVLVASAVIGVTNVRNSNRIKDLNADLASMQDVIKENLTKMDALTEEVSQKTEALTAKDAEIETLTADVTEKAERIEALTADVADKEAQIKTLTADVADKEARIAALNTAVETHAAEIAALTEQAGAAQSQIDALAAESAQKNEQIESLTADLASAQQKLQLIIETINGSEAKNVQGEPAPEAPAALPQVGDVIEGFEVKEIRELPMIGAQIVLFEHQQTGAGLTYIANADTNRAFQLTFKTRQQDDTGLPHVFEHAVCAGSDKYPSAALWFNLMKQTYNTYINAHTTDAMCYYPVASLSEAQLLRYADYYTDSCLHPLVLRNESTFRTEAWRYRMASPDDDLTIEGTVYSEMLGVMSLSRAALYNANKVTFPGASVSMNPGGDPDHIPEMTWEMLKDYHKRYYHPSNCMVYLYGQFSDYTAFLTLLNEAFAPYEKTEFTFEEPDYKAVTEPVESKVAYPATKDSDTANRSSILYYIVCPGMKGNVEQEWIVDNLCSLLSCNGSELMKQLKKAFPTASFSVGREVAAPDDAILFSAANIGEDDGQLFRETVQNALRDIAENGFDAAMVDSEVASLRLDQKLASDKNNPVQSILQSFSYSYAVTDNPFAYLDNQDAVNRIGEMNEQGLYQQAIRDWLLDKQTWTLTTTYPQPGLQEERDEALARKLADIKSAMTDEEKQAVIDRTNAPESKDDAAEYVRQLQAVTVESLPEEARTYEISDVTDEAGIRRINATAALDGVGETCVFLDGSGIALEDLLWYKLYGSLMGELDTDAHTKDELDVLIPRYLYSRSIGLSVTDENDLPHLRFIMRWIALDEDLAAGYDLMKELVYHTRFDNADALREKIGAVKAKVRSSINNDATSLAICRSLAVQSPYFRMLSYLNPGVEYYQFLEQVEILLNDAPEKVGEKLLQVQSGLNNSTNAVLIFAGSAESIAANQPLADAFVAGLEQKPIEAAVYEIPAPAAREAVIVDSNVQYNVLAAGFETLGLEDFDIRLKVVGNVLDDTILVPQLRDQYGVYSSFADVVDKGGLVLLAYMDPNIAETYAVYESIADQMAELKIDQATLDGYIMNAYSALALGEGELAGALDALSLTMAGLPQDLTITYMRALKSVTPETVTASAELFRKLAESGVRITVGSAAAINANKDAFEQIYNPFGAKDNSQVILNDVSEGDAYYEAVRYAFEHGFMEAKTEDSFGVRDEAVVSDWAVAVFHMLGGIGTQDEAVEALVKIGMLPPSAKADSPMSRTDLEGSCNILCRMAGIDSPDLTLPESESENAVRGDVALLLMRLDKME